METIVDTPLVQLGSDTLEKFVQLFDDFHEAKLALSDYQSRIKVYRCCIPSKRLKKIDDLKSRANTREATLKFQFSTTLTDARSGKKESGKLLKLLEEFSTGELSPDSIAAAAGKYADKINFYNRFTGKGEKYVGFTSGMMDIPNTLRGEIYVFHFDWNSHHKQPVFDENVKILQAFSRIIKPTGRCKLSSKITIVLERLWKGRAYPTNEIPPS